MPSFEELSFEEKLERYADLLVRVGVNLQEGGKLQLNAPVEAAPLARLIARKAYEAGAVAVSARLDDPQLSRIFFESAPEAALDYAPAWAPDEALHKIADGYAFLSIAGDDPELLAGLDQARIARRAKVSAQLSRPTAEKMMAFDVNWSVGAMPVPSWARKVFPNLAQQEAIAKLWDAIFTVTRADLPDPVEAWRAHTAHLARVRDFLNERRYASLHFRGPGTDLTVGLADGHQWVGGAWPAQSGVEGVPNLPTDEVFTAPHRERVEGTVRATKPLSARGTLIDGIAVRFEGGKVVEASARSGEDVLRNLIDTDEGSHRLGEVALVPDSSPISRSGLFFYNTLYDENAASHIAIGSAYRFNVRGGEHMTTEEFAARGGNDSLTHVDWMIGSAQMDVDGLTREGGREAVMRGGEFVI